MRRDGFAQLKRIEGFPLYQQLPSDNSCGPMVILMIADYFEKERGHKLYAYEWSRVLKTTMRNDLTRISGTRREKLIRALNLVGLRFRKIHIRGDERDRDALRKALHDNRPVIVGCKIPYEGQPARHYAVLVKMEDETLHFADPFPHEDTRQGNLRPVRWDVFKRKRWSDGLTVWGRDRWGIEAYPSSHGNR
jgi:hypothetical protein